MGPVLEVGVEKFMIADNLAKLRARIQQACERTSRDPKEVQVLAVSKLQSAEKIRALFELGVTCFAENYLQEALEKRDKLSDLNIEWHFIGQLQSNKIRQVAENFSIIHSLAKADHVAAFEKLGKQQPQSVYLQYNVAGEGSKGGASQMELEKLFRRATASSSLSVLGLMCMPPLLADPEGVRRYHRETRETLVAFRNKLDDKLKARHPLSQLSMGTSYDLEVAIEEGATLVRIGTDLFGKRPV